MERIGRYKIHSELGRGAMGIVYRALDTTIGRTVAIKTIRLHELTDAGERAKLRDRLLREAQSAGILSHPGIVTIFDVAEENGMAYVAMECVEGPTLDRLAATEPMDGKLVLDILAQTAAALDFAHKKGIIHRDIKPANIMIAEGPAAKITDFGVARFQSHEMTQAGTMVGTPSYMSPEQIQGKPVDGRSDQFSLAVIAYELLTGEKPFVGESIAALAFRIVHDQPPPVTQLNPTLDWPVDTVIKRALAKSADDRYGSCTEFVTALENACRSCKQWSPLSPGTSQSMATVAAEPVVHVPEPKTKPVRRRKDETTELPAKKVSWTRVLALMVLGGALVGAVLVGGMQYLALREEPAALVTPPAPEPAQEVAKPSPMPTAEAPAATEQVAANPETAAASPASEPPVTQPAKPVAEPAATPERKPAAPEPPPVKAVRTKPSPVPPEPAVVRVVTNPPGAFAVVDGASALSCQTPCSLEIPAGRHTLSTSMAGYRRALRIFEAPAEGEVFVNMERASGTLMVRSDPPGASILIDGKPRQERTPAVLTLPSGPHMIEVVLSGRRESHQVTIRESAITNVSVAFQ